MKYYIPNCRRNCINISIERDTELLKAKQSIEVIHNYLKKLNEFGGIYEFNDNKEEVYYFKNVKPMFLEEMFYYNELFEIETRKPIADSNFIKEFKLPP